ncbi:MAG: TRAP transporter small permease [Deferrisomatales bacterium]
MKLTTYWNWLEEIVLGWGLLSLALLAFLQVVLRYAFSTGLDWAEELSRYASVLLTFLGASLGVKHGTHFSVEALVKILPPRPSHAVRALASALSAVLFAAVVWYGYLHTARLMGFGVTSASLRMPMWIPYAPIALFSAAIAVRFALDAARQLRLALGASPTQAR